MMLLLLPSVLAAETGPALTDVIAVDEDMSLPVKVANAHARLREKLAHALATKGWVVVPAKPAGDCDDRARCSARAAPPAPAGYLVRMSGAPNEDDGYDFLIELFAPGGAAPKKRAAFCNYCDVDRVGEVAAAFVAELLARDVAPPGARASSPLPPRVLLSSAATPPAAAASSSRVRRAAWPPWLLIAGGAAAAGYGAWAIHKDGMTESCQPSAVATTCTHYASGTLGVVGVATGSILVVSGVIWALLGARANSARVQAHAATTTR